MSDRAVLGKIVQALAEYLKRDPASIKESYHLRDDLGLDSMAVIELLYKIEETFNLQIPDEDLSGLTTVGDVAGYVQKRLAPAARTASSAAKKAPAKSKKKKKH
jgi:acyl carrier protein